VSLYLEIEKERDRPRCDVFWNNEILSTIRLQKARFAGGICQPVGRAVSKRFAGGRSLLARFAARARVLVVNTKLIAEAERPKGLFDLTDKKWRGQVVDGPAAVWHSATQAACLFDAPGCGQSKEFYRDLHSNQYSLHRK